MDDLKIDTEQLKDPLFWEKAWQDDRESSLFRRGRKTLRDTVDFWNKRANKFQKNVMGKKGDKRVNRVLDWLERQGVNLAGMDVLDIGAGPGAFTLALAQHCRSVVALEPAEAMVEYLKGEIENSGCENVRVIQETWEEVDLDHEGLTGAFDLVIASMSPGINNLETIQKALDCSKAYFYYSSFAGRRESDQLKKLYPLLFGENLPPWPGQVIFVQNLLYAMGLQFSFEVWEERSSVALAMEEAVDNFREELRIYGKDPSLFRNKLEEFVKANAKDGFLHQENVTRLGQTLVKK